MGPFGLAEPRLGLVSQAYSVYNILREFVGSQGCLGNYGFE